MFNKELLRAKLAYNPSSSNCLSPSIAALSPCAAAMGEDQIFVGKN